MPRGEQLLSRGTNAASFATTAKMRESIATSDWMVAVSCKIRKQLNVRLNKRGYGLGWLAEHP